MIPFNIPPFVGTELDYVRQAVEAQKICGDGGFTKKCNKWLEDRFGAQKVLLTTSGTTALEMATLLCGLKEGDEVALKVYRTGVDLTTAKELPTEGEYVDLTLTLAIVDGVAQ